eukprot:403369041
MLGSGKANITDNMISPKRIVAGNVQKQQQLYQENMNAPAINSTYNQANFQAYANVGSSNSNANNQNSQSSAEYQNCRSYSDSQFSPSSGGNIQSDNGVQGGIGNSATRQEKNYNISEESKINIQIPQFPKKLNNQQTHAGIGGMPYNNNHQQQFIFDPSPRTGKNTQSIFSGRSMNNQQSFKGIAQQNQQQRFIGAGNMNKYAPTVGGPIQSGINHRQENRNSAQLKVFKSPLIENSKNSSGNKGTKKEDFSLKHQLLGHGLNANMDDMATSYGIGSDESDRNMIRNNSSGSYTKKTIQKSMSANSEMFQSLGGLGKNSSASNLQSTSQLHQLQYQDSQDNKYYKHPQKITEIEDHLCTSEMVDEFDEGQKYLNEHIRFDHHSMFMKDTDQNAFQSLTNHQQNTLSQNIDRINWSNLVSDYRTVQSPSKRHRQANQQKIKKELLQEVKQIKQDGDAIVANQGKGFFSRNDPLEAVQQHIESLLPQFDEDVNKPQPIIIDINSFDEQNISQRISMNEKYTLLKTFMEVKQIDDLIEKQKFIESHWHLPYKPLNNYKPNLKNKQTPTIYQEAIQSHSEQVLLDIQQQIAQKLQDNDSPENQENQRRKSLLANSKNKHLQQVKEFNISQLMPVSGLPQMQLSLIQMLNMKREFTIDHHVDMYKEQNLGFFKKMSYNDKMKELYETMIQPLYLIKEIIEPEQEKFQLWECYVDRVQSILNWKSLENDDEFSNYIAKVQQNYSVFNHPAPEYF